MMDPRQMAMQMLQRGIGGNNLAIQNMVNLAQKGDTKGVEQIARNLLQTKGLDYDTVTKQFANQFPAVF